MVDWDNLLSYKTVKIISIRDKRLGLLHYFFMFLIFVYVVGYTIVWQKRYLITASPIGSIRLSLKEPDTRPPPSNLTYCLDNSTYSSSFDSFHKKKLQCRYWDAPLVLYPGMESSSMFISTRVNIEYEYLYNNVTGQNCSAEMLSPDCKYIPSKEDPLIETYIADPERFTIMIDHAVYAPRVGIQRDGTSLDGYIKGPDGEKMEVPHTDHQRVGEPGVADIISVATMLKAAGVDDLDAESDYISPKNDSHRESFRYAGAVFVVYMVYSNTETYDLYDVQYYYQVTRLKKTEFKSVQPILTKNIDKRKLYNRHGVRLIFQQVGNLGKFDFQTLLLSFVSGLGLLAAATFVVDLLALYLFPQKKIYRAYKYLQTKEILSSTTEEDLANIRRAEQLPLIGEERS